MATHMTDANLDVSSDRRAKPGATSMSPAAPLLAIVYKPESALGIARQRIEPQQRGRPR
jgi:hypothetical protein